MGVREDGYTLGQELGTLLSEHMGNVYSDEVLRKLATWHYTRGVASGILVVVPLERLRRMSNPQAAFVTEFTRGFRSVIAASGDTAPVVQTQRRSLPSVDQRYR